MYNPKTKRYDTKNRMACNPKVAGKIAEKYTRSLNKYKDYRGIEALAYAAAENDEMTQEIMDIHHFYSDVPEMY